MRISSTVLLVAAIGCLAAPPAGAQGPAQTIAYQANTAEFLNPERGFMRFSNLLDPWNYANIRAQGATIVYGGVTASAFRNQALSTGFLNQIQAGFDAARESGLKVKFRFNYNNDGGADAPKSVILGHIQQLQPLWEANKDVIFNIDAGFIGGWGEWHSSTNGLDNPTDRAEILAAILDALPVDRTVGIRTPHFKREIFSGSTTSETAVITAANAFDGSDLSRVGHLNDCFLASSSDFGTYVTPGWSRGRELAYIGGESRFVPHGGETCNNSSFCESGNAIGEMTTLHTDYLNLDYHPDVIQRWRDEGSFDEIQRRLGYRFELDEATLPVAVKPAGLMPISLTIDNVGFGELFNPRNVEVVLRHNTTGETSTVAIAVDPRWWSGGTTATVETGLLLPESLAEGEYTVALWMPDIEASLHDDPRYAVRFANDGVWEAATGFNLLTTSLVVDSETAGPLFVAPTLAEVVDPEMLELAGDFNFDGAVNAADYTVWRDQGLDSAAYASWQANYGAVLPPVGLATATPEPGAILLVFLGLTSLAARGATAPRRSS
ncbi:hypothetical protein Pla108_07720 [Botrimarina colliarenosi]|uniref:DUF4832 domain-containing protein n=1 Tax=Botrimarina colliarenosi TaxID=2528001 RepID=A0A5C6AJJ9_9BACT|nr:DUF4832 domain-containing protein [Botrimarina colliarenosi]TWT99829.1 hypothetical protein Pla108_07720 [Botrimarina colliarenosi]